MSSPLGRVAEGDFCGLCFWNNNVAFSSLACIPPTFSSLFIFLHSYLTKNTISFTGRPSRPLCRIALGRWSRLSPFAMACPLYSLFCQKLYFISLTVNYLAGALASPWTRHPHFTRSLASAFAMCRPAVIPVRLPVFPLVLVFYIHTLLILMSDGFAMSPVSWIRGAHLMASRLRQRPPYDATIQRVLEIFLTQFPERSSVPPYILAPVSWFLSECVICG